MTDFITSLIRTYVPIAVGAVIAWLASRGIDIDAETQAGVIVALTGVLQALYYFVARILESRVPKLGGILLGRKTTPKY